MLKEIAIGIFIILLLLVGAFFWLDAKIRGGTKETITAGVDVKTLYETRCGVCHNGNNPEAPSINALKVLPKETILTALKTGVMKNQASTLTDDQHEALATYISTLAGEQKTNTVIKGLCAEEDTDENYQVAYPRVDNWGIGTSNQRYYNQDNLALNANNVSNLELSWVFAFPNASRARVQPTIAGNTLFTASQTGTIYALNRTTGCTRWTFQADAEVRSALVIGRDSTGKANQLYFGDFNATVYALDLNTKKLLWKKKVDKHANATITGTLSLFEDKLYIPVSSTEILSAIDESYECCSFRGSMVALNTADGSQVWKTYSIEEEPTEKGKTSAGTPILAPIKGIIRFVGVRGIGGKVVWLRDRKTGNNLYFAHLQDFNVKRYQEVQPGDTIGTVGNTGNARTTPPHLHFGIYNNGPIDPYAFIVPDYEATNFSPPDTLFLGRPVTLKKPVLLRSQMGGDHTVLDTLQKGEVISLTAINHRYMRVKTSSSIQGFLRKADVMRL